MKSTTKIVSILMAVFIIFGCISLPSRSSKAASLWYVAPDGDDENSCSEIGSPCETINGAIEKASSGDTIYVTTGVYTSADPQVVRFDKDISLSGGWDETYSTQGEASIIDGENSRRGILVDSEVTSSIVNFVIQHGISAGDTRGGGIFAEGALTLQGCSVVNNNAVSEGGGVFVQNEGTLTLNNSTIADNQANSGGGVFTAWGTINVNNSTFHGNFANGGGGINNLGGTISLNNATFIGNESGTMSGGGIRNEADGTVTLQNTIIAANSGEFGPDCNGTFISAGYNLIGDTSECTFPASSGDLLNMEPKVVSTPLGSPAFYVLYPGSPAVDAGNPSGCTDHEGVLFSTDQRAAPRPVDGNEDGSALCDIGSYEYDPANPDIFQVLLPCILDLSVSCPDFYDDFSDPNSGWYVGDDSFLLVEYLSGEYRVRSKVDVYLFSIGSPSCAREDYTVEVDARWEGTPGLLYGITFGIQGNYDAYYVFSVNTDNQLYRLDRFSAAEWTEIIPWTDSPSINAGTVSNHLSVTRDDDQITLAVNGTSLGSVTDGVITGLTNAGVSINSYNGLPDADARFDNFSMVTLAGANASVMSGSRTPYLYNRNLEYLHSIQNNLDR